MTERKKVDLDELSKELAVDADKIGYQQRYGYFSIPYSAYIGDRYYSQDKKKIYRTEERKVITDARGIFTNPGKKGKFSDAYFSNLAKIDKNILEDVEQKAKREHDDYMNLVKNRKKSTGGFKQTFRPSGPQEYKNLFDYETNKVKYDRTVTKEVDKKLKIDKEHRTVFMEKRGIYTQPPKNGTSSIPGILFSDFKEDKILLEIKKEHMNRARSKSAESKEKKEYTAPFKPASLALCDKFQSDDRLYGEDEHMFKDLLKQAKNVKLVK